MIEIKKYRGSGPIVLNVLKERGEKMSPEGRKVVGFMLKEISGLRYCYRDLALGCFEMCIENYDYTRPAEDFEEIWAETKKALETL